MSLTLYNKYILLNFKEGKMARPVKKRRVCSLPNNNKFGPLNKCSKDEIIEMSLDEYETIRLIDYEKLTQEETSEQMNVGRTTVQGIYSEAREKLSKVLIEGKTLVIDGGHYNLCSGKGKMCKTKRCKRKDI